MNRSRQAGNRFLGSLKGLQIRALEYVQTVQIMNPELLRRLEMKKFKFSIYFKIDIWFGIGPKVHTSLSITHATQKIVSIKTFSFKSLRGHSGLQVHRSSCKELSSDILRQFYQSLESSTVYCKKYSSPV